MGLKPCGGRAVNDELLRAARTIWPFKRDPLQMGVEDGIVWAICPGRIIGVNGYVLIPAEGHPWSAGVPCVVRGGWEESAADELEVHGGLTYHQFPWLGFDTAHGGDKWPAEFDPLGITRDLGLGPMVWDRHWTVDDVVAEVKGLARELAKVGDLELRAILGEFDDDRPQP